MKEPKLTVTVQRDKGGADLEFSTGDIATALIIADINSGEGRARICRDGKVLARVARRGAGRAPFWEIG